MHVEELKAQADVVVAGRMVAGLITLVVVQHILRAAGRKARLGIEAVEI